MSQLKNLVAAIICILYPSIASTQDGFDERVIEAIMNNPEVVLMAIQKLEEEKSEAEGEAQAALLSGLQDDLFGGSESIQLVEFFDYRCGYCARSAATMQALPPAYKERVRYIEFPILGEASTELAEISIAVRMVGGQENYDAFHREVFASAGRVSDGAGALRLVQQLGLDMNEVQAVADGNDVAAELLRNRRLAERLGIRGTPTFVGRDRIYGGLLGPAELTDILKPTEDATQ